MKVAARMDGVTTTVVEDRLREAKQVERRLDRGNVYEIDDSRPRPARPTPDQISRMERALQWIVEAVQTPRVRMILHRRADGWGWPAIARKDGHISELWAEQLYDRGIGQIARWLTDRPEML